MALKITVEKVDNAALANASHRPTTIATIPDRLPIQVIVKEDNITGIQIGTLKALLNIIMLGGTSAPVAGAAAGDSLLTFTSKNHIQNIDPIV